MQAQDDRVTVHCVNVAQRSTRSTVKGNADCSIHLAPDEGSPSSNEGVLMLTIGLNSKSCIKTEPPI